MRDALLSKRRSLHTGPGRKIRSPLRPAMDGASSRERGGDPNLRPRAFSPVHRFLLGPRIFSSALLRAPNFPGALRLLVLFLGPHIVLRLPPMPYGWHIFPNGAFFTTGVFTMGIP